MAGTHPKAPLTGKEVCTQLGISIRTLQKIRKAGELEGINKNGRVYYTQESVDLYINTQFYNAKNEAT